MSVRARPPFRPASVFHATYWHEHDHGCEERDCDEVIELSAAVVAAEAVLEMRRNPFATYCRRRGCGHLGMYHEAAGCTSEGCECAEMKE